MTAPPPASAYRDALEAARAAEYQLRLESLQRLDRALNDYATRLSAAVAKLPQNAIAQRHALIQLAATTRAARDRLIVTMEAAVREGRNASFTEVLNIHHAATKATMESQSVDPAVLTKLQIPNLTMAGVWESLGSGAATWRTLLRTHISTAVDDAQYVVTRALLEGLSPDELSKRLRPYVLGSEPFQQAFKGAGEITDKMLRDPAFTKAANRLRYNADRIAFSELHNARGEAELQAFATDPFVKAVRWQLSPNRGKLRGPDACDGLMKTDFFGLGPGIYPIAQVPLFPHPFCRCERVPVTRPRSEMHSPKPNPPRKGNALIKGTGCK